MNSHHEEQFGSVSWNCLQGLFAGLWRKLWKMTKLLNCNIGRRQFDRTVPKARGGGSVLPYKGLMGTCSQPGYLYQDFVLNSVSILSFFVLIRY